MLWSCLSVCLSQVDTVPKWLKAGISGITQKRRRIAQGLNFYDDKDLGEIPAGLPPTGMPNRGGVGSSRRFSINISL